MEHISAASGADWRPCWHCQHFAGMTAGGAAALCDCRRCPRVRSMPESGCSCWSRVPGVDDEPWAPAEWRPLGLSTLHGGRESLATVRCADVGQVVAWAP